MSTPPPKRERIADRFELSASEVKSLLDSDVAFTFLDVREHMELGYASITGALHIPMRQIPAQVESLDKEQPVIVFCHHGMRSAQVAYYLQQFGFEAYNMNAGIDAWSRLVDPQVPRY